MKYLTLLLVCFFPVGLYAATRYCVPVSGFDLNPYREILDGKEIAYLTPLTMPLISKSEDNPGILSEYEFSPDGTSFQARIRLNLNWPSGSRVTPEQVAFAIASVFNHRPIGKRVNIASKTKINTIDDLKKSPAFTHISDREFKLSFSSQIANLTGVLREVFSENSRPNRIWLWQRSHGHEEILSRIPVISISKDQILTQPVGINVLFVNKSKCSNAELTIYPEATKATQENSTFRLAPSRSAVVAILNTSRLDLNRRRNVAAALSSTFRLARKRVGISYTDQFFLENEPGYSSGVSKREGQSPHLQRLNIYTEIPVFQDILRADCKQCKLTSTLRSDTDIQVLSSAVVDGRLIVLQDILSWNGVSAFLASSPKTVTSLKQISALSASTIPPDNVTLQSFARSSIEEQSIVPLARRQIASYSNKESKIELVWDENSQVTFRRRDVK